jgi:hypothetical protein
VIEMLTAAEHRAMALTVELVNLMCAEVIGTDVTRVGDVNEFVGHVHMIQQQILSQAAARAYPDHYRLLGRVLMNESEHP